MGLLPAEELESPRWRKNGSCLETDMASRRIRGPCKALGLIVGRQLGKKKTVEDRQKRSKSSSP